MKFKVFYCLFPLIFSINGFSQQTYFIKYKDYVSKSEIANKILSKQIVKNSSSISIKKLNCKVDYFAKSLGIKY